jgi:hypothetical protein
MDIERVIYKMRVYSVIDLERDGIMLGRSKGGEGATSQIAGARLGRNNHPLYITVGAIQRILGTTL